MTDAERSADEAMRASMTRALVLVLLPGMLFVLGLIYVLSPRHVPPTQSWANGTYTNPCCEPLTLHDGTLKAANGSTHYVVEESKFGNQIDVAAGIGVRHGRVEFGNTFAYVPFNKDSMAVPALGEAKSMHLLGLDDSADYVFVKR
jgi:hypothetical protein